MSSIATLTAQKRVETLAQHLAPSSTSSSNADSTLSVGGKGVALVRNPDDVVICGAYRSALTKAGKGAFRETHPEFIMGNVLKGLIERVKIDPKLIEDVHIGNVLMPGAGVTTARMAALYAGIPESAGLTSVNRQCSSGLSTCATIASAIKAGYIDVGIGAGMESMSMYYGPNAMPTELSPEVMAFQPAADVMTPMGITSENVASEFGVTRVEQDEFALRSHNLAYKAQREGLFKEEIIPITLANGTIVENDDGIRETTIEQLKKLKPAFKPDGSSTAANSSQVTDGAAAVLLARRSVAEKLKLPILAKFVGFSVVGVPARIMGIGPEKAIPLVLKQTGLTIKDIDQYEINEAFASQAVYCVKKLNIPIGKVNPSGGAIAFGHPMGATGARQIATLLPNLRRKKERFGVVSMCIGIGMGAAAVIENEQF